MVVRRLIKQRVTEGGLGAEHPEALALVLGEVPRPLVWKSEMRTSSMSFEELFENMGFLTREKQMRICARHALERLGGAEGVTPAA